MQKITTVDLRTIRTKRLIRDTFEQMVTEDGYHSVTIKALSLRAGINRKTFYSHYDSIEALRDEIVADMLADIRQLMRQRSFHDIKDTLAAIYKYLCALPPLSRTLLVSEDCNLSGMLMTQLYEERSEHLKHPVSTEDFAYYLKFRYIAAAFADLFRAWNQNTALMGQERFIELATGLITQGEKYL